MGHSAKYRSDEYSMVFFSYPAGKFTIGDYAGQYDTLEKARQVVSNLLSNITNIIDADIRGCDSSGNKVYKHYNSAPNGDKLW